MENHQAGIWKDSEREKSFFHSLINIDVPAQERENHSILLEFITFSNQILDISVP